MSEATVCGATSSFTHAISVLVFTVRVDGANAKFLIVIVAPPPGEGDDVDGAG